MRQIIKTNQNFVTGEHYEQRMLKPEQPSRNRVTVQLCDAETGKVVEEAITENAMSPCYESYAYEYIAESIGENKYGERSPWAMQYMFGPKFIVLSDSDISELEDLYFVHGTPAGACARNDTSGSANNPYKGTFNSAESYDKIEDNYYRHIHLVYDWPTSAGNGKIQSVYWLSSNYGTGAYGQIYDYLPLFSLSLPYNYSKLPVNGEVSYINFDKRGNTYFYNNSEQKYYKVLNQLPYLMGIEGKKLAAEPEAMFTKCEVNGCYYTVSSSCVNPNTANLSYKMTFTKYDTKGNVLDKWDEDLITPIPNLVELRNNSKLGDYAGVDFISTIWNGYCDNDGWVGLRVKYSCNRNKPEKVFPSRNNAGELMHNSDYYATAYTVYNVLTKQWLRLPNPWDVWTTYTHYTNSRFLCKLADKNIVSNLEATALYLLKVTDNDIEALQVSAALLDNTSTRLIILDKHATLPFIVNKPASYTQLAVYMIKPLVAHTRLAAPITKTSLNTMKIQYDFFFKIPIPILPPDKCWDLYKTE